MYIRKINIITINDRPIVAINTNTTLTNEATETIHF